jgi:hypothetical protein
MRASVKVDDRGPARSSRVREATGKVALPLRCDERRDHRITHREPASKQRRQSARATHLSAGGGARRARFTARSVPRGCRAIARCGRARGRWSRKRPSRRASELDAFEAKPSIFGEGVRRPTRRILETSGPTGNRRTDPVTERAREGGLCPVCADEEACRVAPRARGSSVASCVRSTAKRARRGGKRVECARSRAVMRAR